VTVSVLSCTSGNRRCKNFSPLRAFSSQSKTTRSNQCIYSKADHMSTSRSPDTRGGTVSTARGRNFWARERVKAHTRRCREHITRQGLRHTTHTRDSTADDASQVSDVSDDAWSVASKPPIGELTVDTSLVGSGSTPKSSPASFSDVSVLFACVIVAAVFDIDNNITGRMVVLTYVRFSGSANANIQICYLKFQGSQGRCHSNQIWPTISQICTDFSFSYTYLWSDVD